MSRIRRGIAFAALIVCLPASAAPWVNAGEWSLRSDIELLASRGLIDNLLTTWPLPEGQLSALREVVRQVEPPEVRAAARRVLAYLDDFGENDDLRAAADVRLASEADTIRDFAAQARDQGDGRVGFDAGDRDFSVGVRLGGFTRLDRRKARSFAPDGSYASLRWGNARFYGGWIDKWYGPGWISSLILSNNARPFPKVGVMRNNPHAFETPWLSWIGPWQIDVFAGLLDGPRIDRHTGFASMRFSLAPVRGLEIALSRTIELCGEHHVCRPVSAVFHVRNDAADPNQTNDEATIELKYTGTIGGVSISPYLQGMNEDNGPFTHSVTSYDGGLTLAGPLGESGAHWRLIGEYTDSVATVNWFAFDKVLHGEAYNNAQYPDGMRYRDRTIGFSLDSDSRLYALEAALIDAGGWTWRLIGYRARISTAELAAEQAADPNRRNSVSSQPVAINQAEAHLAIPYKAWRFELAARWQDRHAVPSRGGDVAGEIGLRYGF